MGMKISISTNWYGNDVSRLWTTRIANMNLRGLTGQVYVSNQPIVNEVLSIPDTQNTFINRQLFVYGQGSDDEKIFHTRPIIKYENDKLNGKISLINYVYDAYNNVIQTSKQYIKSNRESTGYSVSIEKKYDQVLSLDHRRYRTALLRKVTTTKVIPGSANFNIFKEIDYNSDHLPKEIRTSRNESEEIVETFTYDKFGNVTQKTKPMGSGATHTETFTYSEDGRYLKESTDNFGNTNKFDYYTDLGLLKESTDRYGNTTSYKYDGWQREKTVTDYTGREMSMAYTANFGKVRVSTTYNSGERSIEDIDHDGNVVQQIQYINGGKQSQKNYRYDIGGKLIYERDPESQSDVETTRGYDEYGRLVKIVQPTGRQIKITYDGRKIMVDDGKGDNFLTEYEYDYFGNLIKLKDRGGVINYKYHSNNTIHQVDYGSHTIVTEIDDWGRKKSVTDPNSGKHTYEYDQIGQLVKEISPKGSTHYRFDSNGLLQFKDIRGDDTDMRVEYKRDTHFRVDKTIAIDRISGNRYDYGYSFDDNGRRNKITENINGTHQAFFSKDITYDALGRLDKEILFSQYKNESVEKRVRIRNGYDSKSGAFNKITDLTSNKVLWELKEVSDRNQVKRAVLGNGFEVRRKYDKYGKIKEIQDYYNDPSLNKRVYGVNIFYAYNDERELISFRNDRNNNSKETFRYDSLDRLDYIDSNGKISEQKYYENGSIDINPELGTYGYDNKKVYQLANIEVNPGRSTKDIENRLSIQYNCYKKPLSIHKEKEGRVDFDYGPLMNRTHAYFGGEQTDKNKRRFVKIYSSITPAEITYDRKDDKTRITTYVDGNAYDGSIVDIEQNKDFESGKFYLHRDHLGSIVGLSDSKGSVVNTSHYSAWGKIVNATIASSNLDFTGNGLILDRGFTGHEHFTEVGLIHMNGRMYDSITRRFVSPDKYVQDPYNSQSYNRYGYVWNNPLNNIDPSGDVIITGTALLIAAAVGALAGAYVGGVQANGTFNPMKWKASLATLKGVIGGALIGAVSGAAGAVAGAAAGTLIAGGVIQTTVIGIVGGAVGGFIQGGLNTFLPGSSGGFWENAKRGAIAGAAIGGAIGFTAGLLKNVFSGTPKASKPQVESVSSLSADNVQGLDDALGLQTNQLADGVDNAVSSAQSSVPGAATTPPKPSTFTVSSGEFTSTKQIIGLDTVEVIAPITSDSPKLLTMLSGSTINKIVASAQEVSKNGLSAVGRALQKHAGRPGPFNNIKFSHKTADDQGLNILNDIINSKSPIIERAGNGGFRIFDGATGRGFGLSRNATFNGFRQLH